jgi:hypothetical protein
MFLTFRISLIVIFIFNVFKVFNGFNLLFLRIHPQIHIYLRFIDSCLWRFLLFCELKRVKIHINTTNITFTTTSINSIEIRI